MNKSDFLKELAEKCGVSMMSASSFLRFFEETIVEAVQKHNKVQLTGFLTFVVKNVGPTVGRNPKNGACIEVAATSRISVKVGKKLKECVKSAHKKLN